MVLIKTKIQIFNHDSSAFGPGKALLLVAILNHGSISAAAKSMKMSYRRAWDLVTAMNDSFKEPLVITKTGGSHGGGAEVTVFGNHVLSTYQNALKNSECFIDAQMSDLLKLLK
jgi:molybdate transport system regulatory protein